MTGSGTGLGGGGEGGDDGSESPPNTGAGSRTVERRRGGSGGSGGASGAAGADEAGAEAGAALTGSDAIRSAAAAG